MSELTVVTSTVLQTDAAVMQFSVTVTNAHWQGYDIPNPENDAPFFNFKVAYEDCLIPPM